jgi:3-isopropylmalate/(R)-2-methylmalate dehydratase small subunit
MAGSNFGCGSSRENAPIAIKGAKVGCVVAKYFARIFYRNAINIGLPILECPEAVESTAAGDLLEIDLKSGEIFNRTRNRSFQAAPFPETMQEIINAGGMVNFVRKQIGK